MPLRVRYVECDMQRRAFNGHYLTWVDMAHHEAVRALLGGHGVLLDRGVDLVVVAAELRFHQPARFDDELVVNVVFEPPGGTSLRSRFVINRDDDVIAVATMTHVCIDATTFQKKTWPDWFRERLAAASAEDTADA